MRKSTRQNLDELAQWAITIDEAALRGYIGGGTGENNYYYATATENPYGYLTVDPYGSYEVTEEPYYGYGSSTESPGYVEDYSVYCTSTPEYEGTTSEYEGTTPTPIMLDEVIVTPEPTPEPATYYVNADGSYYVVGSDDSIYGYIPEVTVAYVRGGTHYSSAEAFYQANLRSGLIDHILGLIPYVGSEAAVLRTYYENLYELIKSNTNFNGNFPDKSTSFWIRREYGQSVAYSSSGELLFIY